MENIPCITETLKTLSEPWIVQCLQVMYCTNPIGLKPPGFGCQDSAQRASRDLIPVQHCWTFVRGQTGSIYLPADTPDFPIEMRSWFAKVQPNPLGDVRHSVKTNFCPKGPLEKVSLERHHVVHSSIYYGVRGMRECLFRYSSHARQLQSTVIE